MPLCANLDGTPCITIIWYVLNTKEKKNTRYSHLVHRARHREALFDLGRFGTDARVVRQLCHDLSVIQVSFAVHFSRPDPFAARDAARAPIVRDEPKRIWVT